MLQILHMIEAVHEAKINLLQEYMRDPSFGVPVKALFFV